MDQRLRIEFTAPDFFAIQPKKLQTETPDGAGRTYFIHAGRIVAVAKPVEGSR